MVEIMRGKPESLCTRRMGEEAAAFNFPVRTAVGGFGGSAGYRNSQSPHSPSALVAESRGGMKQATAAAALEEGAHYGEPTLGIPATLPSQNGRGYSFNGNVQARRVFYGQWSTTLCQCCTAPSTCCLACFCPCVVFGRIAEIVDRGRTPCIMGAALYEVMRVMTGCACLYAAFFRAKLRAQYHLPENPAPDWAVHFLCEPCSLAQEYRELQHRGYDMSIGWQGNLERERLAPTMPPLVAPPMLR